MKKRTVEWLPRDLIAGPYLALCTSEKQFAEALAEIGHDESERFLTTDHANATMHAFTNKHNGGLVCIVCMKPAPEVESIAIAGLLVHEAVHIFQRFTEHIGETSKSWEFEAYSIQHISQQLMWSYSKQVLGA